MTVYLILVLVSIVVLAVLAGRPHRTDRLSDRHDEEIA